MMNLTRRPIWPGLMSLITAFALVAADTQPVAAQGTRPRPRNTRVPNTSTLDTKVKNLQDSFLRETAALAKEYEMAGHLEKSKSLYETLLKLDDSIPGVKEKIESLNEEILSSNDFTVEVDPGGDWSSPVAMVFKGRGIRLQAEGEYRMTLELTLGPEGVPLGGDTPGAMPKGIPIGALMGVIVTNNKPGEPFAIGKQLEMTPKEDGILLLKVNAPGKPRTTGKLTVQLSGYARKVGTR